MGKTRKSDQRKRYLAMEFGLLTQGVRIEKHALCVRGNIYRTEYWAFMPGEQRPLIGGTKWGVMTMAQDILMGKSPPLPDAAITSRAAGSVTGQLVWIKTELDGIQRNKN